ncbi:hypothetical protein AB1287_03075 [Enterobacter asburiae]
MKTKERRKLGKLRKASRKIKQRFDKLLADSYVPQPSPEVS